MRICVAGDAVVANDSSKAAKKINNKAIRVCYYFNPYFLSSLLVDLMHLFVSIR